MLKLNCIVEIGQYVFYNVQSIVITTGRTQMIGRATVILAKRYRSGNIQGKIKEGDPVYIRTAYGNNFTDEFRGYVSEIGANTPVTIECEDEFYKLKRTPVAPVSWKTTTLADVIKHVAPAAIVQVQNIKLEPYYIRGSITAAKVIESIKDQYGLDAYCKPDGTLYIGLAYGEYSAANSARVLYNTHKNVIEKALQYRRASAVRIKLKLVSIKPDGSNVIYETGDPDGETRTRHEYNLTIDELKAVADERLKLYKIDGLKGSITTFGEPYAAHGMVAQITDPDNPEYNGAYLIDAVTVKYGINGYRRIVNLGKKAS